MLLPTFTKPLSVPTVGNGRVVPDARITLLDVLVPFRATYGALGIGFGTLTLEIFAVVAITGWLKRRITTRLWQWVHRLSYLGFALLFLHAVLGGSDFSDPIISALTSGDCTPGKYSITTGSALI